MITQKLRDLLAANRAFHYRPELPDDVSLLDEGVIDSLGMIALVIHIEETFDIRVPPEDATPDRFRSLATISAYIAMKQNEHHRG
jgi:acyl carrier protein